MSITNELNKIKNAVYGKEVRGAIHDGIKKAYDDASEKDNANMEVKMARGSHSVLNDRLNAMDEKDNQFNRQLAETATQEQLAHGLNTKITKGSVTRQDLDGSSNSYKWNLNDFDEESRQAILENNDIDINYVLGDSAVVEENLSDGSATFDKRSRLGELATVTIGASGDVPNFDTVNETLTFPGAAYVFVGKERYIISENTVIEYPNSTNVVFYYDTNTETITAHRQTQTQNIPESSFLIATIYRTTEQTKDDVIGGWVGGSEFKINGKTPSLNSIIRDNNKSIIKGSGIGVLYLGSSSSSIPPNVITADNLLVFEGSFYIMYGKERYTFLDGKTFDFSSVRGSGAAIHYDPVENDFLINDVRDLDVLPNSAILIAIIYMDDQDNKGFKGMFITCDYTIDGENPNEHKDKNGDKSRPYVINNEPLIGDYTTSDLPACDGTDPNGFDHRTVTHEDIYERYDELVDSDSSYITRNLFGMDSSGELPIYYYDFNPEQVSEELRKKALPTIILVTGAHGNGDGFADLGDGSNGDPPTAVFVTYFFLKDLVENWESDPLLEYIRWNVRLLVVPVNNPWGFNNKSRYNSNGVDLNRNYDLGWDEEDSDHKGIAPFSEKETQYIRDLVNAHKNAMHFCDFHTLGGRSGLSDFRLQDIRLNPDDTGIYIANYSISKVTRLWRGRFDLDENMPFYGMITESAVYDRPIAKNWVGKTAGIFSTTNESAYGTKNIPTHSSDMIVIGAEYIGNWLINVLRYFQRL